MNEATTMPEGMTDNHLAYLDDLRDARRAERERCAQVAAEWRGAGGEIASAIRALGDEPGARMAEGENEGTPMNSTYTDMIGQVFRSVENQKGIELVFTHEDGRRFIFYHSQDCCESVSIEDITGELSDLCGAPILMAEEACEDDPNAYDSGTWTFYKFATVNGYVTVRWYGESNGYYSESVDFRIDECEPGA